MTVDAPQNSNRVDSTEPSRFERLFGAAANDAKQLELTAGTGVFEPSTSADNIYFIHTGQVRVYQVGPENELRLIEILGPNDWFGSAALANTRAYGVRAVAVTRAVVSEVSGDKWQNALGSNPEVMSEVVGQLARRLQGAIEDAGRLVFDDCNERLVKTLLRFSHSAAATRREGDGEVTLRITHAQLAQAVGAARETISLALTHLRQRDLLKTGRNQLFFNPDVLRQACKSNGNGAPQQATPANEAEAA